MSLTARERVELDLSRGLQPADAVLLFVDAASFYALLAGALDEWGRSAFTHDDLRMLAHERRRLLHTMLDRALDVVEVVAIASRGSWP